MGHPVQLQHHLHSNHSSRLLLVRQNELKIRRCLKFSRCYSYFRSWHSRRFITSEATFKPDDAVEHLFDLPKLEMAYACNEARVRLAMEAGIHPLYVDNSHLQLWEMGVYARRAREAGYEVSIVAPQDIYFDWESVDDLLSRCNGRPRLQTISRELLQE